MPERTTLDPPGQGWFDREDIDLDMESTPAAAARLLSSIGAAGTTVQARAAKATAAK
jgi:hypothetical protein